MEDIIVKLINYNSEEYKFEIELRNNVLRKPLGMNLYDENLKSEINDFHIGAFVNNKLVGVLILTPINDVDMKMRQVAVDEKFRQTNVGRKMVLFSEEFSSKKGYKSIQLNARSTAVGFYTKQSYTIISDLFLEINIPHYKMQKVLNK